MNSSDFNQTGGYPLKTERLQELQTAYSIFNSLGALAGNLTIISGCTLTGTTIGDGFVYINGELLEFREADSAGTPSVILIETPVMREFKNGVSKQVHIIRYATFGTADTSWLWSEFKRVDSLKSIQARLLPAGTNPQLYCGSVLTIPTGWQLCDGTNGTPNLKGRFIVGYNPDDVDYNAIGNSAGEKRHTLSVSEIPSHTHDFAPNTNINFGSGDGIVRQRASSEPGGSGTSIGGSISSKGGDQAHENRPPYYTLAYIIYKG